MSKILTTISVLLLALLFSGCAPEPGSKQWCEKMEDKAKGDWTSNEAKTFAKHCVLGNYVDKED
jgi:PBP1b-binding outer membrane lipoprotein LpoB